MLLIVANVGAFVVGSMAWAERDTLLTSRLDLLEDISIMVNHQIAPDGQRVFSCSD